MLVGDGGNDSCSGKFQIKKMGNQTALKCEIDLALIGVPLKLLCVLQRCVCYLRE